MPALPQFDLDHAASKPVAVWNMHHRTVTEAWHDKWRARGLKARRPRASGRQDDGRHNLALSEDSTSPSPTPSALLTTVISWTVNGVQRPLIPAAQRPASVEEVSA